MPRYYSIKRKLKIQTKTHEIIINSPAINEEEVGASPEWSLPGVAWGEGLHDLGFAVQNLNGDFLALHTVMAPQWSVH